VVVVIETPRLILRRLVADDANGLAETLCDPDNMRYYPAPFSRSDVDAWIAKTLWRYGEHGYGLWALIEKESGELAGNCGLMQQMVDTVPETEVAYHLARRFQGKGLATDAARACIEYAFHELGKQRIISLIRPENLPSRRVAERNGMTVEKETEWAGLLHLVYVGRPGSEV
jgi:ribosomal-protein-alanine N-acetyltransferase